MIRKPIGNWQFAIGKNMPEVWQLAGIRGLAAALPVAYCLLP
jgi:hypothetical protein